jgi:ribose transport system permease protein
VSIAPSWRAFGCVAIVLFVGSLYSASFLSPEYLLQQLKGRVVPRRDCDRRNDRHSAGADRSLGALGRRRGRNDGDGGHGMGRARRDARDSGGCRLRSLRWGSSNGVGVAFLRLPSMVVTLAVNAVAQGLMVVHTGGFSPQDASSPAMRFLATGHSVLGIPNALIVWAAIGAGAVFVLARTTFGRTVYAIGNRERAAYLSGARTRLVVMTAFAISGALSAFGGVLLAGYASKAAQAMGDPYLLPAIAAVVLGGTSILGGRGKYLGTVAGVILITLLQSMLSVMQMEEFGRHVTYGIVIIAMLLIYGRGRRQFE